MILYRNASNSDMSHLRDLDLKCHEEPPATAKWWGTIAENKNAGCLAACQSQVPVGMCVYERQVFKLPAFKAKETTMHLHKICVRAEFRRQGIAKGMLAKIHDEAVKKSCPYMTISVPEYRCKPGDPYDVSEWLNKMNFKSTIILPTKVRMYGQVFDQFLFVFEVKYD